jgi:hypothetical protein
MMANPSDHADRITKFLGIRNEASRKLFRDELVNNARGDSVGGWAVEFNKQQKKQIHAEAGPLLQQLGYDS